MLKAASLNASLKNNLTDKLVFSIANNNAFINKRINFTRSFNNYNDPHPILSNDRRFVAALQEDSIKIYKIINDSLIKVKAVGIHQDSTLLVKGILYNGNGPGTMNFVGRNKLVQDKLVVFTNNKLYIINLNDTSQKVLQIPELSAGKVPSRYYVSSLSPDGKKLAIDFKNYKIKVWNIDSINNPSHIIGLDSSDGYINTIRFSSDAQRIIVRQSNKYIIISANSNLKTDYKYVYFTLDNQYAIVQTHGVFELHSIDSLDKVALCTRNFSDIGIDTFKSATAYDFNLSSDWKTFMVKSFTEKNYIYNFATYYFRRNDGDSVFKINREVDSKVFIGKLIKMPYFQNSTTYLAGNKIISLNQGYFNNDTLTFWKKFDTVSNAKELTLLVKAISRLTDTTELSNNILHVDSIKDEKHLKQLLLNTKQRDISLSTKESLLSLKNIYQRLTEIDTANYLSLYRIVSNNYFLFYSDTSERIKDLNQIAATEEALLKSSRDDSLKIDLSLDYWNLSWYLLLTKKFDRIVYLTRRSIELNPINDGVNTNLALGYLLTGQCEKADSIYKAFKGKKYKKDNRQFTQSFLQDLADLEELGIITPSNKEIYKQVQRIRQYLKDQITTLDCKN